MKSLIAGAVAALALSAAARADILTASFSGVVDDGTLLLTGQPPAGGPVVGQTLTGSFSLNTATGTFTSFTVGPFSLGAGATAASFQTNVKEPNVTFTGTDATGDQASLDLEAVSASGFNTVLPRAFFLSNGPSAVNLNPNDPNFNDSSATFVSANRSEIVTLALTSLSTNVPEPAAFGLLGLGLLGLGIARRRA